MADTMQARSNAMLDRYPFLLGGDRKRIWNTASYATLLVSILIGPMAVYFWTRRLMPGNIHLMEAFEVTRVQLFLLFSAGFVVTWDMYWLVRLADRGRRYMRIQHLRRKRLEKIPKYNRSGAARR